MEVPSLYKYVTADRIDILENELIRYTQPGAFNDPFEMPVFIESLARRKGIEEVFNTALEDAIKKLPEPFRAQIEALPVDQRSAMMKNLRPFLQGQYENVLEEATGYLRSFIRQTDKMLCVLSLTEDDKNLLMWAHYAGDHTGFIIEVGPQHATFNERLTEIDDLRYLRKVKYTNNRPRLQVTEIEYVSFILTKSEEWSYEREWRITKAAQHAVKTKN